MNTIEQVKLKKLSPETVKLIRQKMQQLSEKTKSDRERLIKDRMKTKKYEDTAYYQFTEWLERQ